MKCYLRSSPLNPMPEEFHFQEKCQFQRVHFSMHSGQNLFRGCAGEEVREGKTDSGMKQKVRGNWISSHNTLAHQINSSTCQGCTDTCPSFSSKDRSLNAKCLCLSVILTHEDYQFFSFAQVVLYTKGFLLNFPSLSKRLHKNLNLAELSLSF